MAYEPVLFLCSFVFTEGNFSFETRTRNYSRHGKGTLQREKGKRERRERKYVKSERVIAKTFQNLFLFRQR